MAHSVNEVSEYHLTPPEPAAEPETFDPFSYDSVLVAQDEAVNEAARHDAEIPLAYAVKVCIDRRASGNDFLSLWVRGKEIYGETYYMPDLQEAYDWGWRQVVAQMVDNVVHLVPNEEAVR